MPHKGLLRVARGEAAGFAAFGVIVLLAGAATAQTQPQPGRFLLSTPSSNIIQCNIDASNCFTVVDNGNGGGNLSSGASNPSVASTGTIAFDAIWGIDGSCVVATQAICPPHVFLMDPDGRNVRQITFNPSPSSAFGGDRNAAISPDGTKVAFVASRDAATDGTHPAEVYVVNADGSGLHQVTPYFYDSAGNAQGNMYSVAWSPDSQTLAVMGNMYGTYCGTYFGSPIGFDAVAEVHQDGTGFTYLKCLRTGTGSGTALDWSPDGTLIAYNGWLPFGTVPYYYWDIAFIDLSGQGRYANGLTSDQLGNVCGSPHCIHFSPDSTRLGYQNTAGNVSIVNLDGTGRNDTAVSFGNEMWWAPGPAIRAPGQVTLAPYQVFYQVLVWPGSSQQLTPSLLDTNGNLILHTAASYSTTVDYGTSGCIAIGPYGLAFYTGSGNGSGHISVTNEGLTSNSVSFTCSEDADHDGLPDTWERQMGLNPAVATGDDGPDGDPDHDGKTNLEELRAGTHPRGFYTRYFAEGAANDFFDCYFAVANPGSTPANVLFRFLRDDGVTVSQYVNVPATSRRTVNAKSVPGLAPVGGFSTIVESDVEIAVDRTMTWDVTGYGSHAETAVIAPAATWYLAEGATHSGFQLYYLIENPNDIPVDVHITYLRPAPLTPIVLSYPGIAPHSRKTIYVNGENPGLAAVDISGIVTSLTPGGPIIVERAMYLNSGGLFFRAGHDSAGVTAPATDWFLAEGATGFFDLFVLVANPNAAEAHLTVTYLLPGGATVSSPLTVAPNSRWTVYVNGQAPNGVSLANTAVSTKVHSDLPVLVERSMWWPSGGPSVWEEAHNSPGVTSAATRWALADGEQGGARNTDTYVLIANTSAFAGTVRVTALLEDGTTLARDVAVPGNSRTTIFMGDFPDPLVSPFGNLLANKRFGTLIESLPGASGTAEIVVERAMYSDANGVHWAAGTDLVATRLGLPN